MPGSMPEKSLCSQSTIRNWDRHFYLAGPVIQPITDIARKTAHVLKLNAPEPVEERRILQAIRRYPVV